LERSPADAGQAEKSSSILRLVSELLQEKIEQATRLVAESPFDAWLVFVRETADGSDPVLPFILGGSLTWLSALIFSKTGRRVAVVGTYDAGALEASGHWHQVVRYDQDIKPALLEALAALCPESGRIGLNFSLSDEKCDGLTHGMFLVLENLLRGSWFRGSLESAESVCMALRSRKTSSEVTRMKAAIDAGDELFQEIARFAKAGVSERAVYDYVHERIHRRGLGFAWDPANNPIVNSGPNSMVGHGIPSSTITLEPGHVFHVDLGVTLDGYSSDIQRCWYVGDTLPEDVQRGFESVRGALLAAHNVLTPGVLGWQVDEAARTSIVSSGYAEYMHAVGHQVGRVAHDGGALLGPRWERYGDRPFVPVSSGEVYTLELGVEIPGRGYLGLEEMAQVTESGAIWLSVPQTEIWRI
jgi:Xaa-Pro dipeptidase